MEVTRVRMKKRGGQKGQQGGKEGWRRGTARGEGGGSWDSWDTGEGCRPWFLEEIITHLEERLGNWVGKGHQAGAAFNSR